MSFVRGIDAGFDQGVLSLAHWRSIAQASIRFAFLRCTEGPRPAVDARFAPNVAAARAVGVAIGSYSVQHFGAGCDPLAQADAHWKLAAGVGTASGDLPPVLDLEVPAPEKWAAAGLDGARIAAEAAAYLTRIGALSGRVPVLYSYPYFLEALAKGGGDLDALAGYPLWLADYPKAMAWPAEGTPMPSHAPWGAASIWQVSDGGAHLPNGCPADTDVIADEATFARLRAA